MHELAVCQALMSQLDAIAEREQAERILSLELRIGPLSGVVRQIGRPSRQDNGPVARTGFLEGHLVTIEGLRDGDDGEVSE